MEEKTLVEQFEDVRAELADVKRLSDERGEALDAAAAEMAEYVAQRDAEAEALKTEKESLVAQVADFSDRLAEAGVKLAEAEKEVERLKSCLDLTQYGDVSEGAEPVAEHGEAPERRGFTREQIARMSREEYRANRAAILEAYNMGAIK